MNSFHRVTTKHFENTYLAKIHDFSVHDMEDSRTACSLATLLFKYRSRANSHSTSSPSRIATHVMVFFKLGGTILFNSNKIKINHTRSCLIASDRLVAGTRR